MSRTLKFWAIVLCLLAVGAVVLLKRAGSGTHEAPGAVETAVARRLRSWAMPSDARGRPSPIQSSPELLREAAHHFADHCASCHGNDGSGNTAMGRRLYPRAPDMRQAATQQLTDGELYYIIENGVRFTGMPAFGEEPGNDHNEESWELVHFIRYLPRISADELAEMKKMNPKSPMELEREEKMKRFLAGEELPVENSHENHH